MSTRFVRDGLVEPADAVARLIIGRCPACDHRTFPYQPHCAACGESEMTSDWTECVGILRAFTGVHHPVPDSRVGTPYGVGLVEFDAGLMVVGLMTTTGTEGLRVGDPVDVVIAATFSDDTGEVLTYKFAPRSGNNAP